MTLEQAAKRMGISADAFREFCQRWAIKQASVFGSILRDDYAPGSDIDLLVTFEEDARWSLLDLVSAKHELEDLTDRTVDLLERTNVEGAENPWRRKEILATAEPIYEAG